MKKVIKLTEEDLTKIVKKILKENDEDEYQYDLEDYKKADDYAEELYYNIYDAISYNLLSCLKSMDLGGMVNDSQYRFTQQYPEYASTHESTGNEHISSLMELSQNPDLENVVTWMMNGMDSGEALIVDKE
jgi:rubrerythrin